MVKIPEEAKRKLSDVPEESSFKMHFGAELRSLEELSHVFEQISDASFKKHVNNNRNDFADWIRYTVKDIELADRIEITTDFDETKAIIKSRIDYLKNKIIEAEENPAYVDSNRSDFISGLQNENNSSPEVVDQTPKESISKLKPRFPGLNIGKQKKSEEKEELKPINEQLIETVPNTGIESSINVNDNEINIQNKEEESKMNDPSSFNSKITPPPANVSGFGSGSASINMPGEKPEAEKAHIPIAVIKKYVHEAMRDVLIGMAVGICIGFFIGWSVIGAVGGA